MIPQHNQPPLNLPPPARLLRTPRHQIRLRAAVFLARVLRLALSDGLGGADDGGAGCYGGEDAEDHGRIVILRSRCCDAAS